MRIDDTYTVDYLFEKDPENSVIDGFTAYRWVFDQPTEFAGLRIEPLHIYKITIMTESKLYNPEWSWAGWIEKDKKSLFGYH